MGWVNDAISELKENRSVQVQPFGGSMRGRIESLQLVTLAPVVGASLREDDAVLVRWQRSYLLHLIKAIDGDNVLIGNNLGKVNGWVKRADVIGIVTKVVDEPIKNATVIRHENNLAFRVHLDDDAEVVARVRKSVHA